MYHENKTDIRIMHYLDLHNDSSREDIKPLLSKINDAAKLYILSVAPALIAFTGWVIDEALRSNKKRLYFLSRDGYQMYLIAKEIVRRTGAPIEIRYLCVSRYSMRIPGYHLDIDAGIDSICVGGIDVTGVKILKRGGLDDFECKNVLEEVGLWENRDKILNYREVLQFREIIKNSELLKKYINVHSRVAYDDCVGYLKQEGLMKDNQYAIVDSGWLGTLQCSMEKIVKSINPEIEIEGYYFGLYEIPYKEDKNKFHAFYFEPKNGIGRKVLFSNSLFEAIVSAKEGMTVGYLRDNDQYIPQFSGMDNPNSIQIADNCDALELLLKNIVNLNDWIKLRKNVIRKMFRLLMAEPAEYELKAYGDFLFSDDQSDTCLKKVAAELDYRQIKDQRVINKLFIIVNKKNVVISESAWIEGSVVRCGKNVRRSLWHVKNYKLFLYLKKLFLVRKR